MSINQMNLETKREIIKQHLIKKGFYLNDGIKYGLDYLVYTDLPDNVHSKYGLIVKSDMTFQTLIMHQRICNSNNKILIIADVEKESDNEYEIKFIKCIRFFQKQKINK